MVAFFGEIEEVYCQSFRRAVPNDTDDTTSILFRMKNGMSGYLGTMLATQACFRFQVFGTRGWVMVGKHDLSRFEFMPNGDKPLSGASFPVEAETKEVKDDSSVRANLEAFAIAAEGGEPYPVPASDIVQATAAMEAAIKSAEKRQPVKVS